MRVLVLGGDGMLGGELTRQLRDVHEVAVTVRRQHDVTRAPAVAGDRVFRGVDARQPQAVIDVFARFRPDAVVNAIGLVKQRPDGQSALPAVEVNALFPHRLAALCRIGGIRLVHVSTDCVFSGRRGSYREADDADPVDVYGMTKLLGEVREPPALTLRTSIIGLESAGTPTGLVEWFLRQSGQVPGYRRAIYSGLTTMELGRLIDRVLVQHDDLVGLWHVAGAPITKFDLLTMLAERLGRSDVEVVPDDGPCCDRSLVADRLRLATGYCAPSWSQLLDELAERIRKRTPDGGRRA